MRMHPKGKLIGLGILIAGDRVVYHERPTRSDHGPRRAGD